MLNKKTGIVNVFFWGAIWGILEASLGYILHWAPQLISGNIMFPIGATILFLAYKVDGSRLTVLGVGGVAILIKAINLVMPNISMFKVLNPIISMIIQTLLFAIILPIIINKNPTRRYCTIIITSVIWRVAFVCVMVIQYIDTGYMQAYMDTYEKAINYIMINGMIGGIFAGAFIFVINAISKHIPSEYRYEANVLVSSSVTILAIVFTLML